MPQKPRARDLLPQHRRTRSGDLHRDYPFSWLRCVVSVCSYGLLLSDVLRTGLGVRDMTQFQPLEPDSVVYYGPYAYGGFHFLPTADKAMPEESSTMPFWLYKYDTTSIGLRSVVRHLRVPTWPPCATYGAVCDEKRGLPGSTLLRMLDALIDGVARHDHGHVTLRVQANLYDRLYHHIFPRIFQRPAYRTVRAIHFDHERLRGHFFNLCGAKSPRPFTCTESWTNFQLSCPPTTAEYGLCRQVDKSVWNDIIRRYLKLQAAAPNQSVELLVVEATEDASRRSVVYQGRRYVDVVSLFRIRDCRQTPCQTIGVDDYRYEAYVLTTSVADWFPVVAMLRGIGQVYAWFRLACLCAGCYVAQSSEGLHGRTGVLTRWLMTLRTVFLIPSQVVIYGSVFPITCYVLAHLIDSAVVYELVARRFISILGTFHFDFFELVRICSVSMRSAWVAAFTWHILLAINTHRSWSPSHGILGIRAFAISFIASITIFAQARALAWRNTAILQVHEVTTSDDRSRLQSFQFDTSRNFILQVVAGTSIDLQCLTASFLVFCVAALVVAIINKLVPRIALFRIVLFSRTTVPYSAGYLWLTDALLVSWYGMVIVRVKRGGSSALSPLSPPTPHSGRHPTLSRIHSASHRLLQITVGGKSNVADLFPRYVSNVDCCPPQVESMIHLINLAVMTDPIRFFRLRIRHGRLVGLYRSRESSRYLLLPWSLPRSQGDVPIDWDGLELLAVINTRDLEWWDLLQCG